MTNNSLANYLVNTLLTESTRIDHAEDLIFWEGSKGALRSLKSFVEIETGGYKNITLK